MTNANTAAQTRRREPIRHLQRTPRIVERGLQPPRESEAAMEYSVRRVEEEAADDAVRMSSIWPESVPAGLCQLPISNSPTPKEVGPCALLLRPTHISLSEHRDRIDVGVLQSHRVDQADDGVYGLLLGSGKRGGDQPIRGRNAAEQLAL